MTDLHRMPLTDPPSGPSRRGVLRVAAVSGAGVALLAACGGDDGATTSAPGRSTDDGPSTPSAPGGGGLVAVADVPVGGGVILEAEKVVVTQPTAGDFKAFTAVCTHMSCIVSSVEKDEISCACHGSAYSATDGSVINGPAPRPLKEIAVAVEDDQVVEA